MAAEGFAFPAPGVELWAPWAFDPAKQGRRAHWWSAVAKLRPGVTLAQAQAEIAGPVTEVGEGVDGIEVGDRVLATAGLGGFAERAVAQLRDGPLGEFLLLLKCFDRAVEKQFRGLCWFSHDLNPAG